MKRNILFTFLFCVVCSLQAQTLNSALGKAVVKNESQLFNELTVENARNAIVNENFDDAIYIYNIIITNQKQQRTLGNRVNPDILAEYAYVLALAGAQQSAWINADLSQNLQSPSGYTLYLIGSILKLTGLEYFAYPYMEHTKQPNWLNGKGQYFLEKYNCRNLLSVPKYQDAVTQITKFLSDSRFIEALAYSSRLTELYPNLPSSWLLQSSVLQKMGFYTYALQSYQKGISLNGNGSMSGMTEQLASLQKKSDKSGNEISVYQIRNMIYGGLSYVNKTTSITGRWGVYSGPISCSATFSVGIPDGGDVGDVSINCGMSCYYNYGCIFMGLGVSDNFVGSTDTITISPTIGLSFINSSRSSSIDVSLSWNIPCRKGMSSSLGISIGKTFYFNFNGKGK